MDKNQIKKYSAITIASALTLQLAACSGEPTPVEEKPTNTVSNNTEGEQNPASVDEEVVRFEDSEFAESCDEWVEDEDGSAQCIDEDSPHYAQYFFGGLMFGSVAAMVGSSVYKSAKDKKTKKNNAGGSGGVVVPPPAASSSNNNATTNGSNSNNNATTNGGNSTNNNATTNNNKGVNLNKDGATSGKSTNGTTSQSKPSSNNSGKSSSYSSGKSGFSSGGAARGGSSSS